jgi:hypothetical protein
MDVVADLVACAAAACSLLLTRAALVGSLKTCWVVWDYVVWHAGGVPSRVSRMSHVVILHTYTTRFIGGRRPNLACIRTSSRSSAYKLMGGV